ncbi:chitinase [Basidiobolus meristosporus CBS 931.73]|uniref:chitinase n=1 Tax=Basidiobolus meristosporus CBS 931.73 TaxID=1314790 RepID=A0A1Y1Y207_9FUNG|nr:chitinase [Basidiobolus meristosporus CBS 931.73]|eukprot:ORX92047.1 chitinase [Basidiobolus meristosporus CBS 931.73]
MATNGKVIAGYFCAWGIYDRNYNVSDIDAQKITHILYAFANVNPDGEVFLTDKWADIEKHYEDDSWNDPGTNLYGNFKRLALLKKQNRHVKVSLSIGGWTFSANFSAVAADPSKRQRFVGTAMDLLNNLGLDGLDIDWEYPKDHADAQNYVALLHDLRCALDQYAASKGETDRRYLLTTAMPCGESQYSFLKLAEMNQYLDLFYLMAYDFNGSWSSTAGHQANLYGSHMSVDKAVNFYISAGVPPCKLVVGVPMYGRTFQNTDGLHCPYQGVGQGSWEAGVYDYKVLPIQGAQEYFDDQALAIYSLDQQKRELVTYDNPYMVMRKCQYVNEKNLAGVMFWELSADHPTSEPRSLLNRTGANSRPPPR